MYSTVHTRQAYVKDGELTDLQRPLVSSRQKYVLVLVFVYLFFLNHHKAVVV